MKENILHFFNRISVGYAERKSQKCKHKKHEMVSNLNSNMLLYHGVSSASQKLWNVKMKVLTLIS